jgi:hypothetical protein
MEKLLRSRELASLGLAGVLVGYAFHLLLWWPQINDDAFITFRYSWFLANGQGAVFNPGERVEGYSNLLLMLLMAAAIHLFGDESVLTIAKIVGLIGGAAAIVGSWMLCRAWLRKLEALSPYAGCIACAAGAIVAVDCCYALNSTTGLETTLFSALVIWGLTCQQMMRNSGEWRGAGILFGLAALTRPEGLLVFVAALGGRLLAGEWRGWTAWRWIALDVVAFGVLVGGQLAFRYAYYDGELLPNTYWAKVGGFSWAISDRDYILGFLRWDLGFVLGLLAMAPLVLPTRGNALPAILVAVASLAMIFQTGSDWMPGSRLLVPFLPVWAALAVTGLAALLLRVQGSASAVCGVAALLAVVLFMWQSAERTRLHQGMMIRADGYDRGHARLARWLSQHARPGDTVALMDIGLISYLNPQLRILDITGLTDRTVAKSPGEFLDKRYDPRYVFDQKPRFIVIALSVPHGPEMPDYEKSHCWTDVEFRLTQEEEFTTNYIRQREPKLDAEPSDVLAALWGAVGVYEHFHPGRTHYYLAVYERANPSAEGMLTSAMSIPRRVRPQESPDEAR